MLAFVGSDYISQRVDYMSPVYWLFLTLSGVSLLLLLRRKHPDLPRPYRVPFAPLLPLIFAGVSVYILCASMLCVGVIGTAVSFGTLAIGLAVRAALG